MKKDDDTLLKENQNTSKENISNNPPSNQQNLLGEKRNSVKEGLLNSFTTDIIGSSANVSRNETTVTQSNKNISNVKSISKLSKFSSERSVRSSLKSRNLTETDLEKKIKTDSKEDNKNGNSTVFKSGIIKKSKTDIERLKKSNVLCVSFDRIKDYEKSNKKSGRSNLVTNSDIDGLNKSSMRSISSKKKIGSKKNISINNDDDFKESINELRKSINEIKESINNNGNLKNSYISVYDEDEDDNSLKNKNDIAFVKNDSGIYNFYKII